MRKVGTWKCQEHRHECKHVVYKVATPATLGTVGTLETPRTLGTVGMLYRNRPETLGMLGTLQ